VLLHLVSVIEEGLITGRCPLQLLRNPLHVRADHYGAIPGGPLALQNRIVQRVHLPLIFVMTLVATMGRPVRHGRARLSAMCGSPTHDRPGDVGVCGVLLTAVSSVFYLIQERELSASRRGNFITACRRWGTLDELISRFMAAGFVFITLATIAGSTWASSSWARAGFPTPNQHLFRDLGYLSGDGVYAGPAGWRGRKAAILAITALGCSRHHVGGA